MTSNSHVIDTNVLIVANDDNSKKAVFEDVYKCRMFLRDIQKNRKRVSVDSLSLIFKEYFKHLNRSGRPGLGDAFVKWLWDNQGYYSICESVEITEDNARGFVEFPEDDDLKNFDWSDRKFAAVAVKSKFNPSIYNATDSDWWDFREVFERLGIKIIFLCPELVKKKK